MGFWSRLIGRGESASFLFKNRGEQFEFARQNCRFFGECSWAGFREARHVIIFARSIRSSQLGSQLSAAEQDQIAAECVQALANQGIAADIFGDDQSSGA
jgi:hypothetical protein